MLIWIFCTFCERTFSLEISNTDPVALSKSGHVKDFIKELESQLGISDFSDSPYRCCVYTDCESVPINWEFWDQYRANEGEGLNWPSIPEINVFYQI
jgi:hypothetical protein